MATRLASAARNAACDAIADLLDAGASAGIIEIRTGSQPASADDAATGTLLATVALADPAFGASSSGTATLASVPRTATGVAAGTAGWARLLDSTGTKILDLAASTSGGDGQIELSTLTIAVGLTVNVTALTIAMPAS